MASKYELISALAESTALDLSRDPAAWMHFLDTAGRMYRYPFMDQLLTHAQRPDATACAELEVWNEKMNCWVNKDSKGSALLTERNGWPRLRYVFDVSNVHPAYTHRDEPVGGHRDAVQITGIPSIRQKLNAFQEKVKNGEPREAVT